VPTMKRTFALLTLVVALIATAPVLPASAAKRTTKKAVVATTTKRLPPVRIPPMAAADVPAFCKLATDTKAALTELKLKKQQLGSKTPSTIYKQEIELDKVLAKKSPKALAPDFAEIESYLGLFVKLADAKDATVLGKISEQMGSDQVLADYLDSTIRIEGFMRRTCGFPVGV
jgi:hypothetical protein